MPENDNFLKSKYFYILVAIILLLIIRLPFMSPETDFSFQAQAYSAQIESPVESSGSDFLYIITAKFFNNLQKYSLYAQYSINIIILLLLIIAFFELQLLLGYNNHESFIFSLMFSFLTVNLVSTLIGGSYLILGLAAAAGLYNSARVVIKGEDRNCLYLGILLGILSGFNSLVLPIFLPLFIYTLIKAKKVNIRLYSIAVLLGSLALWIVPAILIGGLKMNTGALFSPFEFTLSPVLLAFNLGIQFIYYIYLFFLLFPLLVYSLVKGYYHVPREYLAICLCIIIPSVIFCCFIENFTLLLTAAAGAPFFLIVSASFKLDSYNKYIYTILLSIFLLFQFFGFQPLHVKQQTGPAHIINRVFLQYTSKGIKYGRNTPPSRLLSDSPDQEK